MSSHQKMQKKAKPNGFLMFAQEFSQKHHLSMPFEDLKDIVSIHWNQLPEEQKEIYKNKAKPSRSSLPSFNPNNQALIETDRRQIRHETMMDEVRILIQNAFDMGTLHTTVFTIISGTSFYEDGVDIYPAEFAASLFCLQEGVFKNFQTAINPGQLPLFARHEAQKRSDSTFKYPIPRNDSESDDYLDILVDFINFIKPRKKFPTVFFTDGNLKEEYEKFDINERVIKKILDESGEYDVSYSLKIYPMNSLLYFLKFFVTKEKERYGLVDNAFVSLESAESEFQREQIGYEHFTTSCEFHDAVDATNQCCLSKTRRFGYILAKFCSDQSQYGLQEGKHYPTGFQIQ